MNMKTNLKRNSIIAFCLTAVFLLAGVVLSNRSHAQKEAASPSTRNAACSAATLHGRYAVLGDGLVPAGPSGAPETPFAVLGLMTMNGEGGLTHKVTVSRNGVVGRNLDPGTYTINADCTGTMTITIPVAPFQLNFDLVVADLQGAGQGREFYFIATNGGVVTHIAKRLQ